MQGGSERLPSYPALDRRRQSSFASSSSPAPYKLPYPVAGPSRSSSVTVPSPKTGPRFRTIVHPEHRIDRELKQKLRASQARLQAEFDNIAEKYSSVQPEDDDEIDLWDFSIKKDRGVIDTLDERPFAEGSDFLGEAIEDEQDGLARFQTEPTMGPDKVQFPPDMDELGDWGENSGLDPQFPTVEIENDWTIEDLCDLDRFLQAEAERRERCGEEQLDPFVRPDTIPPSSPSRRMDNLALDDYSDEDDAFSDGIGSSHGRKDSRVAEDDATTFQLHRRSSPSPSSSPPPSSPSRALVPHSSSALHRASQSKQLLHSRSAPSLRPPIQSTARRVSFKADAPRQVSGVSRSASGRTIHIESHYSVTSTVTFPDRIKPPRSRKGKEKAVTLTPSPRERHGPATITALHSGHTASGGSSGTVRDSSSVAGSSAAARRRRVSNVASSPSQSSPNKRPNSQLRPQLWPSSPPDHSHTVPSSSEPPSSPLERRGAATPHSRLPPRPRASDPSRGPESSTTTQPRQLSTDPNLGEDLPRPPVSERRRPGEPGYSSVVCPGSSGTLRACKACKVASGERARLAVYCLGRRKPSQCPYFGRHGDNLIDLDMDVDSPLAPHTSRTNGTHRRSTRLAETTSPAPSGLDSRSMDVATSPVTPANVPKPMSATALAAAERTPGYSTFLSYRVGTPRRCAVCMEAGGERAERAIYCRGRSRRHLCAFVNSESSDPFEVGFIEPSSPRQSPVPQATTTAIPFEHPTPPPSHSPELPASGKDNGASIARPATPPSSSDHEEAPLDSESGESSTTPRTSWRELDVRARDVGVNLGPPPTGRLSSSLLKNLSSASKKGSSYTLASAVSSAEYSLPSPAPSSRTDKASSRQARQANGVATRTPGSMPPPPVPPPRKSSISGSAPSRMTAPPGARAAPQTTPRKRPLRPDPDDEPEPMAPPSLPPPRRSSVSTSAPSRSTAPPAPAAQTTPRKRPLRPDPDDEPEPEPYEPEEVAPAPKLLPALPVHEHRARSHSVSTRRTSTPSYGRTIPPAPSTTPRKKTRVLTEMERAALRAASDLTDGDGLEWGMDEDVGIEVARTFRESSVAIPLHRDGSVRSWMYP